MSEGLLSMVYLVAAVCFVGGLGGLSRQETARRGVILGAFGMALAIAATLLNDQVHGFALIAPMIIVGGIIGAFMGARVQMTGMPELVALLHSFVGLAAVLVGLSSYLDPGAHANTATDLAIAVESAAASEAHAERLIHLIEVWVGVAIGAITFTGSLVAWAKLRGSISGKPLLLPGRHFLNATLLLAVILMGIPFAKATGDAGLPWLIAMAVITCGMGVHLVWAIGGADMPVVVSLLNSYSGWAAAAAGFMLGNDLLIVTGALVGSSGAILSIIMCRAMNRSILNVVFGGFGTAEGVKPSADAEQGTVRETDIEELAEALMGAKRVVIIPGYGMAVARAQHAVHEFTTILKDRGCDVRFAIHPVAGRLPGHMNVLLAEAGVPYDIVEEMDEINGVFQETDIAIVIGANDIVNPGAQTDTSSPIYGMPVLEAWHSKTVVVLKRGMSSGYAGVENPLFYHENTVMLFGDAKESKTKLVEKLRAKLD